MCAVYAAVMVLVGGICALDIVYIAVFRAGYLHKTIGHGHLRAFVAVSCSVEIASFSIDGTLEDQWFTGMALLDCLDEWEQPLLDHIG